MNIPEAKYHKMILKILMGLKAGEILDYRSRARMKPRDHLDQPASYIVGKTEIQRGHILA